VSDVPRKLLAEALGTALLLAVVIGMGVMAERLASRKRIARILPSKPMVITSRSPATKCSRVGCSPWSRFSRHPLEMFFSRDWISTTIEEFVAALDAYIRWYNDARIKISLGFRSPVEHRRSLGIAA